VYGRERERRESYIMRFSVLRLFTKFTPYSVGLFVAATPLFASSYRFADFHHISFGNIPATKYSQEEDAIKADVASSSSFLLKPFSSVKNIKKVQWRWRMTGDFKVDSFALLQSKAGDDAVVRVGLIKSGYAPMAPFFAPSWIKAIKDYLKLAGAQMHYVVAGGPAPAGAAWVSPYSKSMTMVQAKSSVEKDGWTLSQHDFQESIKVVGLWLMADGDNTKSNFSVLIKDLRVTE